MSKTNFLIGVLLLITFNLVAQKRTAIDQDVVTKILRQYASNDAPGMAVGIVQDGAVAYEYYFGQANMDYQIEIDRKTRFNVASNTKQFTAICILQLAQAGKLKLTDDIRDYIPELLPNIHQKITIGHLINHTSGIRDVYVLWALTGKSWWKMFVYNDDALDLLKQQRDLNFKPGTDFMYSNSGYLILAEIIKKVTGTEFDAYSKAFFKSLDMNSTSYLSNYSDVIPHKARPYGHDNGAWKEYPFITSVHGDGALFTTLEDQMQWEIVLQKNNGSYLPQELINQSQQPVANMDEKTYGFGLNLLDNYKGTKLLHHDGATGAYKATFWRFPEYKTSIIVMANNGNIPTDFVAMNIAKTILPLKEEVAEKYPAGPQKIEKKIDRSEILGVYQGTDEAGVIIKIKTENDLLYREIYRSNDRPLEQEQGGLYRYGDAHELKMAFEKDKEGVTGFTIYLSTQVPVTYKKLPPFQVDNAYVKGVTATFFNDETETTIQIEHKEGDVFSITKNGRARNAKLVCKDYFRMNSYKIWLIRNPQNVVSGLRIDNQDRIANVIFERVE